WEREYDTYDRDSSGFGLRFGYPVWELWNMSTGYGYDNSTISNIAPNAPPSIILSQDINVSSFVTLGFYRDTRNGTFVVTRGSLNRINAEYAGGILGGDSQYTKVEGSTGWFFPGFFFDETAFHFKLSAGQAWENEPDKLPDYEKFYLGGIGSLRGFPSRSIGVTTEVDGITYIVGGKMMWYTNVEYLFPIVKAGGLRGVVFYDAGNVYDDRWDANDIKQDVGAGIRWLSPMGPMRLEWAYVINPLPGEDSSNWEFSMGGAF
ncbi:MAG: BamA/TamA family outer membrane protein, partial [Desulfobulbaceae bacterium]|nr:BamA/TamA family outer membrane protein [Desulfobulbaceae bacterium]